MPSKVCQVVIAHMLIRVEEGGDRREISQPAQ